MRGANSKLDLFFRFVRLRRLFLGLVCSMSFVCGVAVEKLSDHYGLARQVKTYLSQQLVKTEDEYQGERELLKFAITDPAIEHNLYYPPITKLEDIRNANQRIFMFRKGYETAYKDLELKGTQQISQPPNAQPVIKVNFRYQNRNYDAFAYGKLPASCGGESTGSLVLPGSGLNQSLRIVSLDPKNYHYGIFDALDKEEIYTFIKPNEDILAWHNSMGKKVNLNFIVQYHLNLGGSYSVSHLVQSLAIAKWMKICFPNTVIAGLSSGGVAAMLVSLQASPDFAIVAAGYSLINGVAKWASITSVMGVPGHGQLDNPAAIVDKLSRSKSQWLFTWGRQELGTYKIDANEKITAKVIGGLPNVEAVIHDDGHIFPVEIIRKFLGK